MIDSCEGHVYLTDWKNHENNSEPDFYLNLKSELSRKVAIMNLLSSNGDWFEIFANKREDEEKIMNFMKKIKEKENE